MIDFEQKQENGKKKREKKSSLWRETWQVNRKKKETKHTENWIFKSFLSHK